MIDLVRRYRITVGYAASIGLNRTERREWSFVAEEICEDDAIWSALSAFRREEVQTWNGWPRDVLSVVVEREADA
ncbi:MAG: hypothetical protein KF850_20065 [Labilithrix sp.]|nr:hypothetical protein [Labilithrix sp.]